MIAEATAMIEEKKAKGLDPYIVTITETLNREVVVFAKNWREAQDYAQDEYYNGNILMDYTCYVQTDFGVTETNTKDMAGREVYSIEEENDDE